VPTAHYFLGGVVCNVDTSTEKPGLFVAGEDASGMHGANRLGGNGVANSTVYGGIAGDLMGVRIKPAGALAEPDVAAVEAALARAMAPLGKPSGDIDGVRRRLYDVMWEDVGILRTAEGLARGAENLAALQSDLAQMGVADGDRRYNLTWMDRLNLESLILVSGAICAAAQAREDSRGAHFREDFPTASDLATSRYTLSRLRDGAVGVTMEPVSFTRVRPGETLLHEAAE
jgi:fumarate reductase flavoprotein subunit